MGTRDSRRLVRSGNRRQRQSSESRASQATGSQMVLSLTLDARTAAWGLVSALLRCSLALVQSFLLASLSLLPTTVDVFIRHHCILEGYTSVF